MTLRVAVLCSDEPHHRYLLAALRARFTVAAVVVEPGASRLGRLARRKAWRDYGWALYHGWRRRLLGLEAYRRAAFRLDAPADAADGTEQVVEWINDPRVGEVVAAARPDVTIVIGTSILREAVLARLGPVVLNVHGGYLPHYRGNHCFFFALRAGDWDRIGTTIHFVDRGVDTGDTVAHVIPPLHPGDHAEALYCRAEKLAIHYLVWRLEQYERTGRLPRAPQPPGGRLHYTRDRKPHHDLGVWLRRLAGRLRVPHRPGARVLEAQGEWSPAAAERAADHAPAGMVDDQVIAALVRRLRENELETASG